MLLLLHICWMAQVAKKFSWLRFSVGTHQPSSKNTGQCSYAVAMWCIRMTNLLVLCLEIKSEIIRQQLIGSEIASVCASCIFENWESTLSFFFFFCALSHVSWSFCVSASVNKGELSVSLRQVTNLAPFAQVVVYTVMPSGETVADSQDFPIQLCLNNKVQVFLTCNKIRRRAL